MNKVVQGVVGLGLLCMSAAPATIQLYNLHVHGENHRNSIDVKRVFRDSKPPVMNIHRRDGLPGNLTCDSIQTEFKVQTGCVICV